MTNRLSGFAGVVAVHAGLSDCEAKRQIGPKRWQGVNLEFEFESRNFRDHGHPLTGCDVIVCWRNNRDGCPRYIEVLADIVNERRDITGDTALRFARFFGNSPAFWMNLQTRYDLEVAEDEIARKVERDVQPLAEIRG